MTRQLCLLSLASLLAVGCVAPELKSAPEDLELVDGDEAADALTRRLELRGTIELGQSLDADFATDGYAGWVFTAAAGANVVLDAAGHDGSDTVMFLYGPLARRDWSRMRPIAANDDSRGSLDSHLDVTLAASGTYLVVVLDYWGEPGSFTLSLGCGGGECRVECGADDSCPTGSSCERVFCIRAPCPSFCGADGPDAPVPPTDPTGQACGGRTVDGPRECPADFFCAYTPEAICGRADAPGTCQRRPEACITLYDPVCGCDGRTYGNACAAASHGMSVDHDGECMSEPEPEPEGVACGARLGDTCAAGEFCSFELDAICGYADATGICRTQPDFCTREYAPVCGCDRRTYSNACTANAAGVSVYSLGEC